MLKWFLTYDSDDRVIDELYVDFRCAEFDISHNPQVNHTGSELVANLQLEASQSATQRENLMRCRVSNPLS
jgi:hypothetical protein